MYKTFFVPHMIYLVQKYNWTETALHHHMLGETPKILFLHKSVTGDVNDLINQAKEMIIQTFTYQNLSENSRTLPLLDHKSKFFILKFLYLI